MEKRENTVFAVYRDSNGLVWAVGADRVKHEVPDWMFKGMAMKPGHLYRLHMYSFLAGKMPKDCTPVALKPGEVIPAGALMGMLDGTWQKPISRTVPEGHKGGGAVYVIPEKEKVDTSVKTIPVPFELQSRSGWCVACITLVEDGVLYGREGMYRISFDQAVMDGMLVDGKPIEKALVSFGPSRTVRRGRLIIFPDVDALYLSASSEGACTAGLRSLRRFRTLKDYLDMVDPDDRDWALRKGYVQFLHGLDLQHGSLSKLVRAFSPFINHYGKALFEVLPEKQQQIVLCRMESQEDS